MRWHGNYYARVAMKMPCLHEHLRSTAVNEALAEWIGVKKNIIVVAAGPFMFAMINAKITKRKGAFKTEEGCLSLDGVRQCAGVKRARYNSSMMDANTLVKGEDYDRLPESYVIFITENDVMGANLPVYHADRIVSETGKPLGDGTHIVYVNGAYRDESPIGKLMHDFSCKNPADMYYKPLAE